MARAKLVTPRSEWAVKTTTNLGGERLVPKKVNNAWSECLANRAGNRFEILMTLIISKTTSIQFTSRVNAEFVEFDRTPN